MREVLRVLQQHKLRPHDLEQKALELAAHIVILCGLCETYDQALEKVSLQLTSWAAREKMQEIISSQEGKNPKIWSEELELAPNTMEITAKNSGTISAIDMKYLNSIARTLGAPGDLSAWVYLHKKLDDKVKAGEVLYTLYAQSANKLALAQELLGKKDFLTLE